jgi:hypothetical protein
VQRHTGCGRSQLLHAPCLQRCLVWEHMRHEAHLQRLGAAKGARCERQLPGPACDDEQAVLLPLLLCACVATNTSSTAVLLNMLRYS